MNTSRAALLLIVLISAIAISDCEAQDRDLPHYLALGERNSPLLKDINYQLGALELDSATVRATFGPKVNGTSNVYYAPFSTNWGYDEAYSNGGWYSAMAGVQMPLFNGGRRRNLMDAIGMQRDSLTNGATISIMDLRKAITAQYILVHTDQQALQFATQQHDLLVSQERVLRALSERGLYQQTDLLTLQVNAQAKRIAVQQVNAVLRSDLYVLNQLCGETDTTTVTLIAPSLEVPLVQTKNDSPVLHQFHLDSIRNTIADRSVDAAYKPTINAAGDLGLNAVRVDNIPKRFGGSAGLSLYVPIYDGQQRRLAHQRVALRESTRTAYRDRYVQQLDQRQLQLREALQRSERVLAELQKQSADEERLIALYRIELESGLVRLTDLFMVLGNHAATVSALIQAESDRDRNINELIYFK